MAPTFYIQRGDGNNRATWTTFRVQNSHVWPADLDRGDVYLSGMLPSDFNTDTYNCAPGEQAPYYNFSLWPCERCGIIKNGSVSAETLAGRLAYTTFSTLGEACRSCPNGNTSLGSSDRSKCEPCPFGTRGDKDGGCDPCGRPAQSMAT